jgi:preprotein translocase subunit SecY
MALTKRAKHSKLNLSMINKAQELKNKIFFVFFILIIYRFGSYIPLPGVDANVLSEVAKQSANGILGIFNVLSGGSLGRMSIFALTIMPYITSSIIVQLLTVASKTLENLKKEGGEAGRKQIAQYVKYGTILLSIAQGLGIATGLENMQFGASLVVQNPGFFFKITAVSTLTGGTLLLMWLGEQINEKGIGNGISMIIFSGIVAGLPSSLAGTFDLVKTGALSELILFVLLIMAVVIIALIVFFERSFRKIIVQYPKRQIGNKIFGGETSHLPLKLNTAGVIPPIFASSILLFPMTIANFSQNGEENSILQNISIYLGHGKPLYIIAYIALIVFFTFFYTAVVFNPLETAENLKKHGGVVPGRRPGKNTAEYLDFVLSRITVIGAIYIAAICLFPEIMISAYSVPFYLGGTSVLIIVNVVMETMTQIQTNLYSQQYEGLMKNMRIKGRK